MIAGGLTRLGHIISGVAVIGAVVVMHAASVDAHICAVSDPGAVVGGHAHGGGGSDGLLGDADTAHCSVSACSSIVPATDAGPVGPAPVTVPSSVIESGCPLVAHGPEPPVPRMLSNT